LVALALVAAGAVLLTLGAEAFTEHIAAAARALRVSTFGLAVLAAGAEPEEAWTAAVAAYRDRPDLAAGNVIGANLVIASLTLGLLALVVPFVVTHTAARNAVVAAVAGAAAVVVVSDDSVTRFEGILLVGAYLVIVGLLWWRERTPPPIGELAELQDHGEDRPSLLAVGWVVAGLAVMVAGGLIAVDGAQRFVSETGSDDTTVGLTLLGLATSAEMLALVWSAHRRGLGEVALAGVLGAVAYNATVSLGVAAIVRPLGLRGGAVLVSVAAVAAAVMSLVALLRGRRVGRALGLGLVSVYVVVVSLLLR